MEDNIKTLPFFDNSNLGKLADDSWIYAQSGEFKKSVFLIALDIVKYNANNTSINFEEVEKVYDKLISKFTK